MAFMDFLFGKGEKTPSSRQQFARGLLGPGSEAMLGDRGGGFWLGKGAEEVQKPIYNPQQEELLNMLLGSLGQQLPGGLQNLQNILGGDQGTFEAFERPARRAFEQQTIPTIAERFTGQGAGAQRSSAFGQALGTAGRELEEDIFSKRIGMQSDALSQLLGMLGPAISPRQYQYTKPRQPGFLESLGVGAAEGVGKAAPLLMGML